MKLIELTQNKFAQVDDEDYDYLMQWKWCAHNKKRTCYALKSSTVSEKKYLNIYMHRLIMNITDSKIFIDHIDHNGLNNQKSNLRICTQSQNQMNKKGYGKSKYKGLVWKEKGKRWEVKIILNKNVIYLGSSKNEIEAAKIYNKGALQYHGEFAKLNEFKKGQLTISL